MASTKFENIATSELKKKQKSIQTAIYALVAIVVMGFIFLFYQMAKGSWQANHGGLGIIPFVVLVIFISSQARNLKAIKDELRKRE